MSNLINLSFETSQQIRIINQNGEFWFVANDVCNILEIQNTSDALKTLDDDEKAKLENTPRFNLGLHKGVKQINIINESGLYALILRSRKAMEKGTVQHKFRKWVTSEVLPTIRKTGTYTAPTPTPAELDPKRQQALKSLVHLIASNFKFKESASHAIWARLRTVTGKPSPMPFSVHDIPVLAGELYRLIGISEQYANTVCDMEKRIFKTAFRHGEDVAPLLVEFHERTAFFDEQKRKHLGIFKDSYLALTQ